MFAGLKRAPLVPVLYDSHGLKAYESYKMGTPGAHFKCS